MIKKTIAFFFINCLLYTYTIAQDDADTSNIESKFPSISLGAGVLTFNGDIGKGTDVSNYSHIRAGYHLNVEQRFNSSFGLALHAMYGKVASSERSFMPEHNLNFESPIIQVGLRGVYHLDNNYILKRSSVIGPYVSLGIAFLKFDPHGDLKDKTDSPYYYWNDGSIRDLPETPTTLFPSNIIRRDYTYETVLKDSATNYSRNTISLPITLGARFQLNDNWEASGSATYHVAFSDYIDNVKGGSGKDGFLYFSTSLTYNFPLKIVDDVKYRNVDFENVEKLDVDADGVQDNVDMCLNTPKDVKVDREGCPLDDDKDGVPDYIDKEPGTAKGSIVDANGVAITTQAIAETQAQFESAGRSSVEFEFAEYDKSKDGYISAAEMKTALDEFFTGKSKYSLEKLQQMVQFYVRQ